jgi:hypothetical protein
MHVAVAGIGIDWMTSRPVPDPAEGVIVGVRAMGHAALAAVITAACAQCRGALFDQLHTAVPRSAR